MWLLLRWIVGIEGLLSLVQLMRICVRQRHKNHIEGVRIIATFQALKGQTSLSLCEKMCTWTVRHSRAITLLFLQTRWLIFRYYLFLCQNADGKRGRQSDPQVASQLSGVDLLRSRLPNRWLVYAGPKCKCLPRKPPLALHMYNFIVLPVQHF